MIEGLFCLDGNVHDPLSITDYIVDYQKVNKADVRKSCKKYLTTEFEKSDFENQRHISLAELVKTAELKTSYYRTIPVNENCFDYDIWGSSVGRLFDKGGRGATKVWVLTFTDNPLEKVE